MNAHYKSYIELGKSLALNKGLIWDFVVDGDGDAVGGAGWDLTACVGEVPPPAHYLRDLGTDSKTLNLMNSERAARDLAPLPKCALSLAWQDFIKAAVAEQLLVKRNSTGYVYQSIARPLRVMGTCVENEPWELTLDDLQLSIRIAKEVQASGKLGDLVAALVKVILDTNHICDAGPMYGQLVVQRSIERPVSTDNVRGRASFKTRRAQARRTPTFAASLLGACANRNDRTTKIVHGRTSVCSYSDNDHYRAAFW